MKAFKAIAAMSLNRVIGAGNTIPWHLPEDFKWFKATTLGQVVVMGRKTFESLGRPLPHRKNLILTRQPQSFLQGHAAIFAQFQAQRGGEQPDPACLGHFIKLEKSQPTEILLFNSLDQINPAVFPNDCFICGGSQIYAQALPRCSDLYLTLVNREVAGDAFFPPFEHAFKLVAELRDTPEFKILHYRRGEEGQGYKG